MFLSIIRVFYIITEIMKYVNPEHHMVKNGHISKCQVCNSEKLHLVLDLGHQPLCDSLLTKEMLSQEEVTYPLRMLWCEECSLAQLDYCVDGNVVYHPNYPYRTGITKELVEYLNMMSKSLISKYNLKQEDLVIDLGSNDGTLLSGFKEFGSKVIGVEPTNISKIANENGIETIQEFFSMDIANQIKNQHGEASLILATNMFAHMSKISEVVSGVWALLKNDGVFVFENHYLLDVLQGGQFDTIYHEHLRTYSLKSLIKLFSYYDFTVTDVERGKRYGGNIRVHVTKGKNRPISENVTKLLNVEKDFGLYKLETYIDFADRVRKAKRDFLNFILKKKEEGKTIVANSCPGRSVTLLNYYDVGTDLIPYIAEQPTSLKLDMFLPGKLIPIVNNQILINEQPDYVILLAWHYAEPIMKQLKDRGLKSNFIIPLPDLTVVEN
jgi:SAM-dependent methyltransferase